VQRQLIVNGNVLGRYGVGINEITPKDSAGNPNFAALASFNFGYQKITGSYPVGTASSYTVAVGDTLRSVANAMWGDAQLWYRLAEANGLSSERDLKVGQTLIIPSGNTTAANRADTFKPYDPSKITGDTSPNLPAPAASGGGGCGGLGQILLVVVAVVVTVMTSGAAMTTFGPALGGALAGAAGALASQVVGNAFGILDGYDWKAVALAAVGGAVTAGMSGLNPLGSTAGATANAVVRAALGNALTQGMAVAVGMQQQFNWRTVAVAAVSAGINESMSDTAMRDDMVNQMPQANGQTVRWSGTGPLSDLAGSGMLGQISSRALSGMASGISAAVTRGGSVRIDQIATDVFGNMLGESVAGEMQSGKPQVQRLDDGADENSRFPSVDGNGDHVYADVSGASPNYLTADYQDAFGAFGTSTAENDSNALMGYQQTAYNAVTLPGDVAGYFDRSGTADVGSMDAMAANSRGRAVNIDANDPEMTRLLRTPTPGRTVIEGVSRDNMEALGEFARNVGAASPALRDAARSILLSHGMRTGALDSELGDITNADRRVQMLRGTGDDALPRMERGANEILAMAPALRRERYDTFTALDFAANNSAGAMLGGVRVKFEAGSFALAESVGVSREEALAKTDWGIWKALVNANAMTDGLRSEVLSGTWRPDYNDTFQPYYEGRAAARQSALDGAHMRITNERLGWSTAHVGGNGIDVVKLNDIRVNISSGTNQPDLVREFSFNLKSAGATKVIQPWMTSGLTNLPPSLTPRPDMGSGFVGNFRLPGYESDHLTHLHAGR
jgi:hypothetical protein